MENERENSVKLEAQEIAEIISMMKSSTGDHMLYKKPLPQGCTTIVVTENFVNLTVDNTVSFVVPVVENAAKTKPASIGCKGKRTVEIVKRSGSIEVR
jgi:hypothetical protein